MGDGMLRSSTSMDCVSSNCGVSAISFRLISKNLYCSNYFKSLRFEILFNLLIKSYVVGELNGEGEG